MTNDQLAQKLGIRPTSLHHRVCTTGSYFGLIPEKLPNGRLLWPDDAVEKLVALAKAQGARREVGHAAA